jgi:hypothetical protein
MLNVVMLNVVILSVMAPWCMLEQCHFHSSLEPLRETLSMVDLFIKIGCFVKEKYIVSVRKAADLN